MSYIDTLPKVQELINSLLIVLSDKEKYIVENRFSLNGNPRLTLEKIGDKYHVTRERIRQIEKNALRKLERNVNNTQLRDITGLAVEVLDGYDGIIVEHKMIEEMLQRSEEPEAIDTNSLKLTVDLDKAVVREHNTIRFRPYWRLKETDKKIVPAVCKLANKLLKKEKEVMSFGQIAETVNRTLSFTATPRLVRSVLQLDRQLKVIDDGVGLASWRNINPKTLRDKIFFVFNQVRKPLHYVDIANQIADLKFDNKTVNTQAVHNELIRFEQFVLIGRGIYALKEWGYEQGTVADVIARVLEENGSLNRDEIVEKVLEHRQVKRITILLNLKNKDQFNLKADGKYVLEQ